MTEANVKLRPARKSDAADMALLMNIAGHGLPSHAWENAADADEVDNPFEIGRIRARRDQADFSWRNAMVAVGEDDDVIGMMIGYLMPEQPDADNGGVDPMFVPLVELEVEAGGTWYLNALAVYSDWRGKGVGQLLMQAADAAATRADAPMSLIVADNNAGACRFYEREGFEVRGTRPLVSYPGGPDGARWLLMVKD